MAKRFLAALLCVASLSLGSFAQSKKSAMSAGAPDKALMQKIWDGWATLDPANVAQYYASGPHTFFDIAPVKYDSWDEYQAGVKNVLADYKSATCTVNDDAVVHVHGDLAWGTATIKTDLEHKSGKRDLATMRWTVIWEKQGGKWLIVHEHVSEPLS
ncbi:MAG TPA: nuclear transport factor 2 family protein [Terriglobales bacterium]|nr:nuclear transport factor 2 family protein [Terriglobales bacterium]